MSDESSNDICESLARRCAALFASLPEYGAVDPVPTPVLASLKLLVKWIVLPPGGPLLVAFGGLAIWSRCPRLGRTLVLAGLIALALLSMPVVGDLLIRSLDRTPAFDPARRDNAQAIVILGGGARPYAAEYGGATVGSITLARLRYGARLARETGLPVLVSGGPMGGAPPEGLLMRDVLVHEFGVPVRWIEQRAANTHENAVRSARMLKASGISRVILVGHSFDFPRALREFELAGIDAIPAPIAIPPSGPPELADFVPNAHGLVTSYYALYEMLANVVYEFTTGWRGDAVGTK